MTVLYVLTPAETPGSPAGSAVPDHCRQFGDFAAIFADATTTRDVPWFDRPAGRRLFETLAPVREVVVASGAMVYTTMADLAVALGRLSTAGCGLTFAAENTSLAANDTGTAAHAIAAFGNMQAAVRGETIREGIRSAKQAGRRHTRDAGYGYRWSHGKRVTDIDEQHVIALIRRWRTAGHPYERIAWHLSTHGVRTPAGRPWSLSRVRRVCQPTVT